MRMHLIFIDRIAAGTSAPYLASRSKMTNLGADPNGNASRNCWTVHRLFGWLVTLKCRMRRRSWLMHHRAKFPSEQLRRFQGKRGRKVKPCLLFDPVCKN